MYAHIYHQHFDQICALGIEGELIILLEDSIWDISLHVSPSEHELPPFLAFRRRSKLNHLPENSSSSQFSLLSDKDLIPLEEFNKSILEETSK